MQSRPEASPPTLRVAAAGDVHALEGSADRLSAAFGALPDVDLVLLAGDLTGNGRRQEAAVLAEACRTCANAPIVAVLGNHDWHERCADPITELMGEAGVIVLDRGSVLLDLAGLQVGIAGGKGFIGGFLDSILPDYGEPLLRRLYAETTAEVEGLEQGLCDIAGSDLRLVLLHYAPTVTTIVGERRGIWPFLGSERLAAPIARHSPDAVFHGHAHAGHFEGAVGQVPVFNVATPVLKRDFALFELTPTPPAERRPEPTTPLHDRRSRTFAGLERGQSDPEVEG